MPKPKAAHHDRLQTLLRAGRKRREILPNGVTVLSEVIASRQAVNFGVWVTNGSQGDAAEQSGLSHFLEHLVFKGSPRYRQKEISAFFDAVGGAINAYTTREYIGFTGTCTGVELAPAADRLFDMVLEPTLPAAELEKERLVIVEECKMSDDEPESRIYDLLYEGAFPGTGIGRPIQGYLNTVTKISRAEVARGHRAKFTPDQLVVAAAGNFDADKFHRQARRFFGGLKRRAAPVVENPARPAPFVSTAEKQDLQQTHLVVAWPGFPLDDPRRWAAIVMDNAFGGTLSSRLFQNLREKRGLCYTTYSNATFHQKTGLFTVYAATSKERTREALALMAAEVRKLRRAGLGADELALSKKNLINRSLLSMDSLSGRLNRMIMNEIAFRHQPPLAEVIAEIERVTAAQIKAVARDLTEPSAASLAAVAPPGAIGAAEKELFVKEFRH